MKIAQEFNEWQWNYLLFVGGRWWWHIIKFHINANCEVRILETLVSNLLASGCCEIFFFLVELKSIFKSGYINRILMSQQLKAIETWRSRSNTIKCLGICLLFFFLLNYYEKCQRINRQQFIDRREKKLHRMKRNNEIRP